MLASDMKASPEFSEASRQISSVWEQASPELRTAIRAAFDQASDRQSSYVNKLHLLLALLKDGRVRSHVTLAERDINKIELLITEKLRISGPHFDQPEGAAQSNTPKWGNDFLALLSDAANKKRHYRHPAIDVWLVFDLLACDTDLKGNLTYSQSGYANDHDVRINEISELTKDRQAEVNQLKSDVRDLELANQRLKGELDQTRAEFKTLAAEFAQVRQQLVKIPGVEQRLGQTEQTAQQLIDAYSYVRGALDNNGNLMNALFANLRPTPPPAQTAMATAPAPEPETNGWFGRKRRSEPTPSAPPAAMHAAPPANAPTGAPAGAVVLNSPVTVPQTAPQAAATAISSHVLGIPSVRAPAPGMASGAAPGLPNGIGHHGLPSAAASSAMAPSAAAQPSATFTSANPSANGIKPPAPAAAPPQAAAPGANGSANGLTNVATNGGAPGGQSPAPAAKPLAMVKA